MIGRVALSPGAGLPLKPARHRFIWNFLVAGSGQLRFLGSMPGFPSGAFYATFMVSGSGVSHSDGIQLHGPVSRSFHEREIERSLDGAVEVVLSTLA